SKVLKGRQGLSPEMAERAAQMFGVRVGWLFFGEGDPAPGTAQAREEGRRAGLREAAEVILWLADSTGAPPAHVPNDGLTGPEAVQRGLEKLEQLLGRKEEPPSRQPARSRGARTG